MIPIYMRSGVQSLPEYLEKRFDARVRLLNSWLVLATGTALGGIGLYAMAQVIYVVFGWPFTGSVILAATVVMIYASLGGLRATIYNEVFQLLVIVLGLAPLLYRVATVFHSDSSRSDTHWHLWSGLPMISPHASLDQYGVIIGLGFVLSCSYWCTDFVLIQRATYGKDHRIGPVGSVAGRFWQTGFFHPRGCSCPWRGSNSRAAYASFVRSSAAGIDGGFVWTGVAWLGHDGAACKSHVRLGSERFSLLCSVD